MMTVMIGLSTTAYSSGIGSMVEEFGVANVVGQIGMMWCVAARPRRRRSRQAGVEKAGR